MNAEARAGGDQIKIFDKGDEEFDMSDLDTSDVPFVERAQILTEALPYIQRFRGKTMVIKYGGAAMKDPVLKRLVVDDLVFLSCVGIRPVFVHGGGPEINSWLGKLGIEAKFLNGLRVTDSATMDVVEMVLAGRVNKGLVSLINRAGGQAVGLCGKDGSLISAKPKNAELGFVGEVTGVNPALLNVLAAAGYIPVISSVGADEKGNSYNINADTLAGDLAAALGAEKLVLLTDVTGVLSQYPDESSLISHLTLPDCQNLISESVIAGGMVPKIGCCMKAIQSGVSASHIIDGRRPHSILLEVFTEKGIGTMITNTGYEMMTTTSSTSTNAPTSSSSSSSSSATAL
ncbi:Acetylglutamate kinase [Porphyridium purpureum]|uniref:acetylglutamate kinase n=1 Tax=Porphyridium purpureum TaxID=35688 RepID=A0A5J4Z153_PORPP|nr:Acetylglutamate kinase [Porphyridium purpureum]|eukprot:POR2853..scf208_2